MSLILPSGALKVKPPKLGEQNTVVRPVPRMAISAAKQHRRSTSDSINLNQPIITSSRGRPSDVSPKFEAKAANIPGVTSKKSQLAELREVEDRLREEVQIRKRLQQKQLEMKQKDEEVRRTGLL